MPKPEINIGLVGHVDHGKTTLVEGLSGKWTDQHSEELRRGISIRLGYADATFRKCPDCRGPGAYTIEETCPECGAESEVLRTISFVDAPGHETLMATMLSGAAIMDGAVLVIAANEECPQPQTEEHLMALDVIGIQNIVIVQNKIDLVSEEGARENYEEIKEFASGTVAEDAPVVPVSAQQRTNLDVLIQAMEENLPTPKRDLEASPLLPVARSFDINRPGTTAEDLRGGVIGGSVLRGVLRVGDEVEVLPGRKVNAEGRVEWKPLRTVIDSMQSGGERSEEADPGGLLGVGTTLDPSITKGDSLAGQILGEPGELPPVWKDFTMETELMERVVGSEGEGGVEEIKTTEPLMLSIGTATTVGVVTSARENEVEVRLKRPICAEDNSSVAVSRRVGSRWRLIGIGTIKG